MASPTQADIVNELYSRRDTLPADKRAVVEELHNRFAGQQPSQPSTVDKVRQFMLGSPNGNILTRSGGPDKTFEFPPWLNAVATAGAIGSGAQALGDIAEYGIPAGIKAIGAGLKSAATPKPTGRIAKFAKGIGDFYENQAASKTTAATLDEARQAAARYDAMRKGVQPQAPASAPPPIPRTASGRPLTADEIAFQEAGTHPGTAPEDYPQPPPETPVPAPAPVQPSPLETSATGYDPAKARALNKQLLRYSRGSEGSGGRSYGVPRRAPGGSSPPATEPGATAQPAAAPLTPPEGIPQQIWDALPRAEQEGIWAARNKHVIAQKGQPAGMHGADNMPDTGPELPPEGTPKRAPRKDAAAQKRSEEIAALNRHADTFPLAQQTVQQGVTSKDLLALPEEARQAYMQKIGLGGRSDATWRTYIGHVLRAEKLKK